MQMIVCTGLHTLAQQLCTKQYKFLFWIGWQISFMEESNMTLLRLCSQHQVFMYVILASEPGVCACVIYCGQKAYLCWVQWRPALAGERNHMLLIISKCLPSPGGPRAPRSPERERQTDKNWSLTKDPVVRQPCSLLQILHLKEKYS